MKPEPHHTRSRLRRIPKHVREIRVERKKDALIRYRRGSNVFVGCAGKTDFNH